MDRQEIIRTQRASSTLKVNRRGSGTGNHITEVLTSRVGMRVDVIITSPAPKPLLKERVVEGGIGGG